MTAIERINQLSHRIFNTSMTERNVARSSNPFAASNFQQNILTEDVFESSKNIEGNKKISSKRIRINPCPFCGHKDCFDIFGLFVFIKFNYLIVIILKN